MIDDKKINLIVSKVLNEYFSLTGPSLPTYGSAKHSEVGPFSQYIRSADATLDRILDSVNNDIADLDPLDAEELLTISLSRIERKIDTIRTAVEKKLYKNRTRKRKPLRLKTPLERKK